MGMLTGLIIGIAVGVLIGSYAKDDIMVMIRKWRNK
jgi:Na+/citrate or Na+/malate symporter